MDVWVKGSSYKVQCYDGVVLYVSAYYMQQYIKSAVITYSKKGEWEGGEEGSIPRSVA